MIQRILRRGEKFFGLDLTYIAKGGFWLTIGQFAATGASLLIALVFANFATQEVYGNYKYTLSIVSVITVFTLPGLNYAVATAVAAGNEGNFLHSVFKKIKWGLVGSMASLGLAGYFYLSQSQRGLAIGFLIVAVFLPFMDSVGISNTYLQSKKLFREAITYTTISQVFATLCIVATIFFTHRLGYILFAYFASWTAARLLFLIITLKKFPPNKKIDPAIDAYGKHFTISNALYNVTAYLDSIVLFHYLGAVPVAIFNIAIAPTEQIRGLAKNIPALVLPKLTQRTIPEIQAVLAKRLGLLFLMGLASATIYTLAAPFLFQIFFKKYHAALLFSQIFSFSLALRLPAIFMSTVLQSKLTSQPKSWLYYGTISQTILIILLLVLTRFFGINGVITSRYIYFVISFFIAWWQWRQLVKNLSQTN